MAATVVIASTVAALVCVLIFACSHTTWFGMTLKQNWLEISEPPRQDATAANLTSLLAARLRQEAVNATRPSMPTLPARGKLQSKGNANTSGEGAGSGGASTSAPPNERQQGKRKGVVLHMAGLEGTGHHFYQQAFKKLCHHKSHCRWPQKWSFGLRNNVAEDAARFEHAHHTLGSTRGDTLLILETGSFPMGDFSHSKRQSMFPNETHIVEAAALAGFDARVIVSLRQPAEILIADCIHRHIESCRKEADTLAVSTKALIKQLRAAGSDFYRCGNYGDVDSMTRVLAWGLGLSEEMVRDAIESVWGRWSSNQTVPSEVRQISEEVMRSSWSELENICAGRAAETSGA